MASQMKMQRKMLTAIEEASRITSIMFNCKNDEIPKLKEELMEKIRALVSLNYQEARLEQVVAQVVEKAKQDLLKMIAQEQQFQKEEKDAERRLTFLRNDVLAGDWGNINHPQDRRIDQIAKTLSDLRHLVTKEAATATALTSVSQDLAKLMKQVKRAEK